MSFDPQHLGRKSPYAERYDNTLLQPILRATKRAEIGISSKLPFKGEDIWNAYELSWLNAKGKPEVYLAEVRIPCESPYLIESKSFKLYLNSFNQERIDSPLSVAQTLTKDLSDAAGLPVSVVLTPLHEAQDSLHTQLPGRLIDTLDISCDDFTPNPHLLAADPLRIVQETLTSNLLKSNCLVTHQPDWGSVQISYHGPKIDEAGLLRYIVSFRNHDEFHEQCVERIFKDILYTCHPSSLTVYARYTRRGGLDINPYRTTLTHSTPTNIRLIRQ